MTKVLRGAGRAAGEVIADEAKLRSRSQAVREDIVVTSKVDGDRVVVRITVRPGWARSVAIWLEYGTAAHFISVDDSQRQGMSVGAVNRTTAKGTLVVNGRPVGKTVWHPGAQPFPFLRPAFDTKIEEAFRVGQAYIRARVRHPGREGMAGEA